MGEKGFRPLEFERLTPEEQERRIRGFRARLATRRSVRSFAPDPVPIDLLEEAIRVAAGAPSGANLQPWHFVVVSDPATRRRIREAAEREERENYERRFPRAWKDRLEPLGTDWHKAYLEIAPHLIVVFAVTHGHAAAAGSAGEIVKHYYVMESVGIATGFLLAALHVAGLATLTHTPSPMGFLREILRRPTNERAYMLIPVGYPAPGATVPDITRKDFAQVCTRWGEPTTD